MIDIENQLYTALATALRTAFTGIDVSNTPPHAPSSFPYVSIYEADNRTSQNELDSSLDEMALLTYEINIFSNKSGTKKTECRAIAGTIDTIMRKYNFVRTELIPVDNREDYTIFRLVARYQGKTDGTNMYQI